MLLPTYFVFLIRRDDLLELESRRRVFEYVQKFPGLHLREIGRGTSLHPNHVKYHLQYLQKHDLVSSRKEDGYWRFFPREEGSVGLRETVGADKKQLLALLRQPVPLHTVLLLLERGQASQGELAQGVGVAQATLHYHLGKMERTGLVVSWKDGRERYYKVGNERVIAELLLRFRPPDALVQGFLDAWETLQLDLETRTKPEEPPQPAPSGRPQWQAEGDG
jgi:predicted transcriptional regulator